VPSERAEIQVRSDRATGAGELMKFGQPVWYRFSFKIAGDWPQDVPAPGRHPCRTVIQAAVMEIPLRECDPAGIRRLAIPKARGRRIFWARLDTRF
jgi:hypothetical protein